MKGHTNNPYGRPKGTPNKATAELRQWLKEVIDSNREQVIKDLEKLESKDRLQIIERFMQYVIPKQAQIREEVTQRQSTVSWEDFQRMINGEKVN